METETFQMTNEMQTLNKKFESLEKQYNGELSKLQEENDKSNNKLKK